MTEVTGFGYRLFGDDHFFLFHRLPLRLQEQSKSYKTSYRAWLCSRV